MEAQNQPSTGRIRIVEDARRQPRFKINIEIRINSKTCGTLKGQTVDVSKSGVSALLKLEVPVGEIVELDFTLPFGRVVTYALVRQRSAFRYGFQFIDANASEEILHSTCRQLEVEQSLLREL